MLEQHYLDDMLHFVTIGNMYLFVRAKVAMENESDQYFTFCVIAPREHR